MCELKIVKHALHHNIRLVRRLAGETRIIGVVKGNGYGLGLVELAGHLMEYGVNCLAVSELEEALELRRWGLSGDIMLLSPLPGSRPRRSGRRPAPWSGCPSGAPTPI